MCCDILLKRNTNVFNIFSHGYSDIYFEDEMVSIEMVSIVEGLIATRENHS
jgi:hypothetical protein